jgi:predicted aminopeptidase
MKVFWIPVTLAALGAAGGIWLFSGCYTLSQGVTMLGYLHKAVPLESLSRSPRNEDRRFAEQVLEIRRFALDALGLKAGGNYTRYVALDRDYLAAVVSASAPDSFTPHTWWFPVVGAVPYKGFFDPRYAAAEGEELQKKRGLDVWIRRVDAFSTLGWFSDPLYSYMQDYPVYRLADLIIHESLHATVYLKGQSQFNEELAEFVGREGARRYTAERFGADSSEYAALTAEEADRKTFVSFIQGIIAELEAAYAEERDTAYKLRRKEEIITAAQRRFEAEYDALFKLGGYRGFSALPVNNGYFALFTLYYSGGYLEDLYERSGRDLARFIAAAKTVKPKGDPRSQLRDALNLGASP